MRRVVLVCGPPGAGKTTYAQTLDLTLYDIDDPTWRGNEHTFQAALRRLGHDPGAQAVVVRTAPTQAARSKVAATINATDVHVIDVDADTCIQRVIARKRQDRPLKTQISAVKDWWKRYEPGPVTPVPTKHASPKPKTAARGYGAKHKQERAKARHQVRAGKAWCWRCGSWISPSESWDLGHDDEDRSKYRGPEHAACNRGAPGRRRQASKQQRWQL